MSGKAIDGYIQGATAFLDINANGVLDAGEPSDVTDELGQYDFNLSSTQSECQNYAATIIDVPVGAIDSDFPEEPISEAYRLTYPPAMATTTDEDILAVTPLSTIVWNGIQRDLEAESTEASCDALLANEALREDIVLRVEEQESRVAYRYNITVDELYGDYIEAGNTEVHELAQNLVPGLQKSYYETSDISKQGYDYAYVEYFLANADYPHESQGEITEANTWYRLQYTNVNGDIVEITAMYDDELTNELGLVEYMHRNETVKGDVTSLSRFSMHRAHNWIVSDQWFGCNVTEGAIGTDLTDTRGYETERLIVDIRDVDDCLSQYETPYTQYEVVTAKTTNGAIMQESTYRTHTNFNHGDLAAKPTSEITLEDLATLSYYSADFDDADLYGADEKFRMHNDYTQKGDVVQVSKLRSSGQPNQTTIDTYYVDGTHRTECVDDVGIAVTCVN
ncbi:hypothetical protein VcTj87_15510 [Vibrio comitans]